VPTNSLAQKPLGDVAATCCSRPACMSNMPAWISARCAAATEEGPDRPGRLERRCRQLAGIDWLNPAGNPTCTGDSKAAAGTEARMGALRSQWLAPPALPSNSASAGISRRCHSRKSHFPIGQYKQRPRTARALPASSTARRSFGMYVHHEHDRDLGSYVLSRKDGAQDVLRDHWYCSKQQDRAVTRDRPSADQMFDKPRPAFVLRACSTCTITASAKRWRGRIRGRQRPPQQSEHRLYGAAALTSAAPSCCRRPSDGDRAARILQLLKGGVATVMEPFRNTIPEISTPRGDGHPLLWRALSVLYV